VLVGEDQRLEQRVLARKIVIEGAFADAHRRRHVAEAGAEVALLREEVERGVQDRLPRALPVGVPRTCHKKLMVVHLIGPCQLPPVKSGIWLAFSHDLVATSWSIFLKPMR